MTAFLQRTAIAAAIAALGVPAGSAATLVSATPIAGAPPGSRAFAIEYASTDFRGRPNRVTGLLIEPTGPAPRGGRPVVAWEHGTTGILPACAPSGANGRFTQIAGLDAMVRRGWVVVATDYAGLGSPGPHPFLVADATARSVIDAVRAARDHASAQAGSRFALWGLSQGGHAALVSAERAARLAPGLTLVGTAAAAPPTDLKANFSAKGKATARGVLTAFASASWSEVYGAPLATLGPQHTVRLIERLSRVCALGQGARLGAIVGAVALGYQLRNVDVAHLAPWAGLLARNSADPRAIRAVPLLVAQSDADLIVSAPVTRAYVHAACAAGTRVRWVPVSGEHGQTAEQSASVTIAWLADRFANRPAPSDCGSALGGAG